MTYFYILAAVAAAVWLAGMMCGALALRWSCCEIPRRFTASVILAAVALGVGYLGLHSHITYSRTVNGRGWSIDAKWFYLAPLVLGAVALGLALWRRFRPQRAAAGSALPKIETRTDA